MADIRVAQGLRADAGVRLGYRPARIAARLLVLGPNARLRTGSVIYLGSRIGARFQCGHNVVIREDCTIGDDVSVWSNSVLDYGCRIGARAKIHSNCYVAQFTEIGPDAFLAPGVTLANDLYPGQPGSAERMAGPCIGPAAQIGVNATVLPFVRVGAGSVIGAGAVVTRDVPDGTVAFGNPARVHGSVRDLAAIESRITAAPDSASRYRRSRPAVGQLRYPGWSQP